MRGEELYVVYAQSGEYSDHCEWYICYYHDEKLAQSHVDHASAREREISQWLTDNDGDCYSAEFKEECVNKWDVPQQDVIYRSYTGVNYGVLKVGPGPLKKRTPLVKLPTIATQEGDE